MIVRVSLYFDGDHRLVVPGERDEVEHTQVPFGRSVAVDHRDGYVVVSTRFESPSGCVDNLDTPAQLIGV